ncbi:MAG: hypothetical protein HQK84_08075 [Nitrospinae bacterium]|nr:hypothetical protein [Nitrospinota bacterium]
MDRMRMKPFSFFFFLLLSMLIITPATGNATISKGLGVSPSSALNAALQKAVESELGVYMDSQTITENFEIVKDEIVSHSKGYVSSYKVLREGKHNDGTYFIKIDAVVNQGLVKIHLDDSLEILMKMSGHPKLLVFGLDDDMNSISSIIDQFQPLTKEVVRVFKERFRFDVLDLNTLKTQDGYVSGKFSRKEMLKFAQKVKADFIVMVKVNINRKHESRMFTEEISLQAVRASDAILLGENVVKIPRTIFASSSRVPDIANAAINTAKGEIFGASITLAKEIVRDIQGEVERGKGFRYSISLLKFPKDSLKNLIGDFLILPGYVRHKQENASAEMTELAYWSNLNADDLREQIENVMKKNNLKYKFKINGRLFNYKWQNPDFD